jgi:hypothetical protein
MRHVARLDSHGSIWTHGLQGHLLRLLEVQR